MHKVNQVFSPEPCPSNSSGSRNDLVPYGDQGDLGTGLIKPTETKAFESKVRRSPWEIKNRQYSLWDYYPGALLLTNGYLVIPNMMGYYCVCLPHAAKSTRLPWCALLVVQPKQAPSGAVPKQPLQGLMASSGEGHENAVGSSRRRSEEH